MKRLKLWILFCLPLIGFSCQEENINDYPPANMRSIVRFTLNPAQNGGNVLVQHVATIDQSLKIIKLELPADIDLTKVKPEITISPWCSVTPESLREVDLSGTLEYTVTAQSGKQAVYSIETVFTYKYTASQIYAVTFSGITDPETGKPLRAAFSGNARNITLKVPQGTDITKLVPEFELSPASHNATYDKKPGVAYDFTEPVTFTVKSENGASTTAYTIGVEIE